MRIGRTVGDVRYLVIGASGHAQEVAWSLSEQVQTRGERIDLRFFDDTVGRGRAASDLGEVVGKVDSIGDHILGDDVCLVLGVGLPRVKEKLVERLAAFDLPWATVIHPKATIGPNVVVGEGSYIAAGAIITVNARVGRFATVNLHCQVAHDDTLGDLVTLHPDVHLSGNVTIGKGCELGTGSIVIPGGRIGDWAVLGAGSVVIEALPGDQTYVGIPARPLRAVGNQA